MQERKVKAQAPSLDNKVFVNDSNVEPRSAYDSSDGHYILLLGTSGVYKIKFKIYVDSFSLDFNYLNQSNGMAVIEQNLGEYSYPLYSNYPGALIAIRVIVQDGLATGSFQGAFLNQVDSSRELITAYFNE